MDRETEDLEAEYFHNPRLQSLCPCSDELVLTLANSSLLLFRLRMRQSDLAYPF